METVAAYTIFRDLTIIIVAAKLFGLLAQKLHAPAVVGQIVAGLVIGPGLLSLVGFEGDPNVEFITKLAEIGVVLLMFSAGLGTNLKELASTGFKATLIACAGVFIPLVGGALLFMCFYGFPAWGSDAFYRALFIGCIMTATSVSITVAALKKMGFLKGRVGTTIMSAAIIDDVIGILVFTFVISMKDTQTKPFLVVLKTLLFFVFAALSGIVIYRFFKEVDKRHPHTRRVPIAGLALCFGFAFIAERVFGIADITGAYVAGIILCSLEDSAYIERKMDVNSYMLFGPVFFASIGLKTDVSGIDFSLIWFCIAFVLVALVTKVIGCGLMARACGFDNIDSLKIGVGMMTRGEVALVVAQKGLNAGLVASKYFTAVILLIIVSSIVVPILLKLLYQKKPDHPDEAPHHTIAQTLKKTGRNKNA